MARKRGELGSAIRAVRLRKQNDAPNAPADTTAAAPPASGNAGTVEVQPGGGKRPDPERQSKTSRGRTETRAEDDRTKR